ncbi:MAG: Fe-S cluster assembly protein SufD [Balneolaceae bacterium]
MGIPNKEDSVLHKLIPYKEGAGHSLLEQIRESSLRELKQTRFPTSKDEDWRFLNLKPITRSSFVSVDEAGVKPVHNPEQYFIPESDTTRLVFINGFFNENLSSVSGLPEDVVVGNLKDYLDHPSAEKFLNKLVNYENDPFTHFNGMFFEDGGFIYLPEGVNIEQPVQLLNLYTDADEEYFATPRVLLIAEANSNATIIEDHIGVAENKYLTVPVSEFKLHSGAHIHHVRIQRDTLKAVHVSRPIAYLEKNGEYHSYTISIGGHLTRNEPRVVQEDEEVSFTVDGLVLIDGEQIADTHSLMDHRFSHGESHQLHKVVVKGNAHSIFNGKIFVRKDAQKIDSFQENRNLLLSVEGLVNTKPQLEIFADDVLCSHGATIGQLDPEEVFYLESRGMTKEKAREVLTYAFALETIENVKVDSVHELLINEVKRYTTEGKTERLTV